MISLCVIGLQVGIPGEVLRTWYAECGVTPPLQASEVLLVHDDADCPHCQSYGNMPKTSPMV